MMTPQPHFSLVLGPLVLLVALVGGVFAAWLAVNDPIALGITVLFFYLSYRVLKLVA